MKTILRNLFYTLKRFQTASVLNLMGLSAAFAASIPAIPIPTAWSC